MVLIRENLPENYHKKNFRHLCKYSLTKMFVLFSDTEIRYYTYTGKNQFAQGFRRIASEIPIPKHYLSMLYALALKERQIDEFLNNCSVNDF